MNPDKKHNLTLVAVKCKIKIIKVLQALHHAPPLHLHEASAITLSKIKSKGRCISFSLNIINIDACDVHVLFLIKMFNMIVSFFQYIVEMAKSHIYCVHCSKGHNFKNRLTCYCFVFCTLSHGALHL